MRELRRRKGSPEALSASGGAADTDEDCSRPVAEPVSYALRQVASAYGCSFASTRKTPRNVLHSSFQKLRRAAQAKKRTRMAERFAEPGRSVARSSVSAVLSSLSARSGGNA